VLSRRTIAMSDDRVFISHASEDQKIAETICEALEQRGLFCWVASRDIQPGENFQEAIVRAIRVANVVVLVFTHNSNSSDEVKKEIALASRHGVAVIPVRVEDVLPNDALAYELATRQWIDLSHDWDPAIERLIMRLAAVSSDVSTIRGNASPPSRSSGSNPAQGNAALEQSARPDEPFVNSTIRTNAYCAGFVLANLGVFLGALALYLMQISHFAPALVAVIASLILMMVGRRTLEQDTSVRATGIGIGLAGLLAVAAVMVTPYFTKIPLLERPDLQTGTMLLGMILGISCLFYAWEWRDLERRTKRLTSRERIVARWLGKPHVTALFVLCSWIMMAFTTAMILYAISEQTVWMVGLVLAQAVLSTLLYVQFHRSNKPHQEKP
jgi:hypothetical protein